MAEPSQETPASAAVRSERAGLVNDVLADWDTGAPAKAADPDPPADAPAEEPDVPVEDAPEEVPVEPGDDTAPDAEPVIEEPGDPEIEKRLSQLQAAERRQRDGIAEERRKAFADLEEREKQLAPALERAKRLEELERRGIYDPAAVLLALGWTEDRLELASKQIYSRSKTGQQDPRLRDLAAREMRDLEYEDKFKTQEKRLQELQQSIQQQQSEREVHEYLGKAIGAVTDETPIVKAMVAKNPDRARQKLREVASQLYQKTNEIPDAAAVVRELEKIRRQEYADDGHDVSQFARSNPKTKTPAAGKQPNGKQEPDPKTKTTSPKEEDRDLLKRDVAANLPL